MSAHIPHGQAGHICSGHCGAPKVPSILNFDFSASPSAKPEKTNVIIPPAVSLAEAAKTEYACAHPSITSKEGLGKVLDQIDLSSNEALRPSLHNAGHFELSEQMFANGRGFVSDLHRQLIPVFENVSTEGSTLNAEQASLTAMILRLTSTDLMKKTAGMPDFKPLEGAWERIFNNASEAVVGEVVANLMAIYKEADEVNKTAGTSASLAINFGKVVMGSVREKIFQEAESPIRKWFVQSLPSAYYPNLTDLYVIMLQHGSSLEIDVALNALDFFASNPNLGGDQRNKYSDKYKPSLSGLLSGNGNSNVNDSFLQSVARYGREISYLDKARQIIERI